MNETYKQIGPYFISGMLGRGGMGVVYRAVLPNTGKTVALKLLNPSEPLVDLLGMDHLREIFIAEAETMSRLQHPNIVQVLDIHSGDGQPYFTMEYFCNNLGSIIEETFTLEDRSRILNPVKVIDYGNQVLEGIRCIHSAGIIHRDIKPQNILVTEWDTVMICDFGMSKQQDETSFSADGLNIGSPYYTPPEQMNNPDKADQRSDLYSTGVMLYRMLTGELPGMKSFLLSRIHSLYDSKWDDFFFKALDWNPGKRFQSAEEMAEELQQLELHWEKQLNKHKKRQQGYPEGAAEHINLRSVSMRVSGRNAKKLFNVNSLWQPVRYIINRFAQETVKTVHDNATGLIWQRAGSDYPVDRAEADALIEALNASQFAGITTWRMPTVNELLSLANDPVSLENTADEQPFADNLEWFWTCDRRSGDTSWYVNTRLGYTGPQDNGCHYYARAVSTV